MKRELLAGFTGFGLCIATFVAPHRSTSATTPVTDCLLVVAPAAWRESLEPFVAERARQLGYPVEFLALESATEGARTGDAARFDAPELLKRELFARWKANRLSAVLLVGDADTLPIRFMTLDRGAVPAFNTAFYPSDLYYADLAHPDGSFDDWNRSRDGMHAQYFGEVHGETNKSDPMNFDAISYEPEIAVGRWPVSTAESASLVATKTLAHQRAVCARAPADEPTRVDFFFCGGWIDNRDRANALVSSLAATPQWNAQLHSYFDEAHLPTREAFASALKSSPAAMFHTGHGQPWGWEGCLDASMLTAHAPSVRPPLLFSIGCSTSEVCTQPPYQAYTDTAGVAHRGTNAGEVFIDFPPAPAPIQRGDHNSTSIAEEAVRQGTGGAIATIGCVTGSQPCAQTLLDGFVAAMVRAPDGTVGAWWRDAITHYVREERLEELTPTESWYPASVYFQGMKFVLLGDPTVRLQ